MAADVVGAAFLSGRFESAKDAAKEWIGDST
jgi:hypothetical protein